MSAVVTGRVGRRPRASPRETRPRPYRFVSQRETVTNGYGTIPWGTARSARRPAATLDVVLSRSLAGAAGDRRASGHELCLYRLPTTDPTDPIQFDPIPSSPPCGATQPGSRQPSPTADSQPLLLRGEGVDDLPPSFDSFSSPRFNRIDASGAVQGAHAVFAAAGVGEEMRRGSR